MRSFQIRETNENMKSCSTLQVGRQYEATRNYNDVVVTPDVAGDESEMKLGIFEKVIR